jgi:hypothetical protein
MKKLIALWMLSLVAVAALASALTFAQTNRTEPRILTGSDIGFRIEGSNYKGEPIGTIVIRLDGEWIVPGVAPTVRRVN